MKNESIELTETEKLHSQIDKLQSKLDKSNKTAILIYVLLFISIIFITSIISFASGAIIMSIYDENIIIDAGHGYISEETGQLVLYKMKRIDEESTSSKK